MSPNSVMFSAVVLLACAISAQAESAPGAPPITFQSISPPKLAVDVVSFVVGGEVVLDSAEPCLAQPLGSACLTKVQAAQDKVNIVYSVMPQFTANLTDSVQLKACYSNYSSVDRPWRKYNDIIAKSKKCPFVIAANLNPVSGNATWKIPSQVPIGTYFVRAFVLRNSTTAGKPPAQVAFGTSKGYFEVVPFNGITTNMKIAAGCCAVVGPSIFLGYFAVHAILKKNK